MDKLKPSQLLRLGSKQVLHMKNKTFYTAKDNDVTITAACALGMIAIAETGNTQYEDCINVFYNQIESIPLPYELRRKIVDMNDDQNKSPEEIAQYLESINM